MTAVSLRRISNFILEDVDLDIDHGELLVLVGPSGAGKTTLLNVIAGLTPYKGRLTFDNKPADRIPSHKRHVGYVFQDLLLFPHLTVKNNILVAMKRINLTRGEKLARVKELLRLFRIDDLGERLPEDLSGGEKQRAALARSVACKPKILLLDEPFASLDYRTARYLRQEFKNLQEQLGLSTLFVTHNMQEARELGRRIAVLRNGRFEQVIQYDNILAVRSGVDAFGERPNLLPCRDQVFLGNGLVQVQWAGLKILVPDENQPFSHLAILPQEVYISSLPPPGPQINRFSGIIKEISEEDGMVRVIVTVGKETLCAEIDRDYLNTMSISPGDRIHGILKLRSLHGIG